MEQEKYMYIHILRILQKTKTRITNT